MMSMSTWKNYLRVGSFGVLFLTACMLLGCAASSSPSEPTAGVLLELATLDRGDDDLVLALAQKARQVDRLASSCSSHTDDVPKARNEVTGYGISTRMVPDALLQTQSPEQSEKPLDQCATGDKEKELNSALGAVNLVAAESEVRASREYALLSSDWSACMLKSGYTFTETGDAPDAILRRSEELLPLLSHYSQGPTSVDQFRAAVRNDDPSLLLALDLLNRDEVLLALEDERCRATMSYRPRLASLLTEAQLRALEREPQALLDVASLARDLM